ncbi:MAG: uncharacterized protein JWR61_1119 [Ferruginibacter sp.]|uniref:hypothetical protein n=1 Tax=Ferruginibacter sp. TaxID=1940288 RepID=UPI002658932F|nr:hypothetical protein [Ferruginibacter sp.]MDB5276164.1 uncharacterized protein [Ferruginibacter sp.]
MKTFSTTFLILTFTIAFSYASGQVNDQNIRQIVLQKSIVDSTFIFGKWIEKDGTETHLKYLGQVTSKHGQTFKIINSMWFWGLSHRATSRILIFNGNNQYLGNYYVTVTSDLPTKIKNGNLIFKNADEDCDKKLTTVINLKNGLPKHFFRKCKGKYGDIYNFETE